MTRPLEVLERDPQSGISLILISGRRYAIQETTADGRSRTHSYGMSLGKARAAFNRATGRRTK